jgi:CheY-like chemotaxis protein
LTRLPHDGHTPDLIIIDLDSSEAWPEDPFDQLKASLPAVPIVAVTGYGRSGSATPQPVAGAQATIIKPVIMAELALVIRSLLNP